VSRLDEACRGWPPRDIRRSRAEAERLAGEGPAGCSVLDAGCGTGEDSPFLAARGAEVTGIDPVEAGIERARGGALGRGTRAAFAQPFRVEWIRAGRFGSRIHAGAARAWLARIVRERGPR